MAELKPCPFCGGSVSIAKAGDNSMLWWFITRGNGENRCRCRVFMESEDFAINSPMQEKQRKRNDLIEAWNRRAEDGNALIAEYEWIKTQTSPCNIDAIQEDIARIERQPAVDAVEVVHGTWLDWHGKPVQPDEFYRWWACSECKYQYVFDEAVKKEHFPSNYCPNCGAKMDKGEEA